VRAVLQEILPTLESVSFLWWAQTSNWCFCNRKMTVKRILVPAAGQTWSMNLWHKCGGSLMRLGYF
jgi:hypothetical protein